MKSTPEQKPDAHRMRQETVNGPGGLVWWGMDQAGSVAFCGLGILPFGDGLASKGASTGYCLLGDLVTD